MSEYTYTIRQTQWRIERSDGNADYTTDIDIYDSGKGEYVEIVQYKWGCIHIYPEEWPAIRDSIERAMRVIAEHEATQEGK